MEGEETDVICFRVGSQLVIMIEAGLPRHQPWPTHIDGATPGSKTSSPKIVKLALEVDFSETSHVRLW
jgi:hypothetical protein